MCSKYSLISSIISSRRHRSICTSAATRSLVLVVVRPLPCGGGSGGGGGDHGSNCERWYCHDSPYDVALMICSSIIFHSDNQISCASGVTVTAAVAAAVAAVVVAPVRS